MRLSDYRLSDYRLAAYIVVGAVFAAGVVFALDSAFAPAQKVQANGAPMAVNADGVRKIPLARTSADDLGDPQGKLTPVYPAAPGKDLPVKDVPVIQPKQAATTAGSASATAPPAAGTAPAAQAPASQVAATAGGNVCNVAACAAAYRSFRESDCSYQPFGGPRRYCEGAPDQNATQTDNVPTSSQPQAAPRASFDPRTVRRLPPPSSQADDDDDDSAVVMESPQQRYDLRRNWVVEPQE